MAPVFRADHIGSLLRPTSLLELRTQHGITGSYAVHSSVEDVQRATEAAVAEVVRRQQELFIRPITTGELERSIFYAGFFETLEGLTVEPVIPIPSGFRTNFPTVGALQAAGITERPGIIATGKICWTRSAYGDSWALLRSLVPEQRWGECKITIPSPTWQHMQLKKGTAFSASSGYASDDEYFVDMATAYRAELKYLYGQGLRNVQVDDPNMTFFVMDGFRQGCEQDGIDPEELLDQYIKVHNACIAGRPKDMQVGIHLCRGNFWAKIAARGVAEGSYERIAEKVFRRLDYDTLYLEFDDERSGDFEPLRFVPEGKNAVLGIVSTKRLELERMDDLVKRVNEAVAVIARAQGRMPDEVLQDSIAVSPQCGFASQCQGGSGGMLEQRQWEKLVLVRDLARKFFKDAI